MESCKNASSEDDQCSTSNQINFKNYYERCSAMSVLKQGKYLSLNFFTWLLLHHDHKKNYTRIKTWYGSPFFVVLLHTTVLNKNLGNNWLVLNNLTESNFDPRLCFFRVLLRTNQFGKNVERFISPMMMSLVSF